MDQHNQESCPGTCISTVNVSVHLEKTRCTYFQALQEQFHATVVKEHLTVIRGLISNVPEGAPGELHHLIALRSRRERERNRFANVGAQCKPATCGSSLPSPQMNSGVRKSCYSFSACQQVCLFVLLLLPPYHIPSCPATLPPVTRNSAAPAGMSHVRQRSWASAPD